MGAGLWCFYHFLWVFIIIVIKLDYGQSSLLYFKKLFSEKNCWFVLHTCQYMRWLHTLSETCEPLSGGGMSTFLMALEAMKHPFPLLLWSWKLCTTPFHLVLMVIVGHQPPLSLSPLPPEFHASR